MNVDKKGDEEDEQIVEDELYWQKAKILLS